VVVVEYFLPKLEPLVGSNEGPVKALKNNLLSFRSGSQRRRTVQGYS
jgi:hypothetical protein